MNVQVLPTEAEATKVAVDWLTARLAVPGTGNVTLAGGNSPLGLYAEMARRQLPLSHLTVFALDEYVGVPSEEPRNCANLIRRTAIEPLGILPAQYHVLSSLEADAENSIRQHETKIRAAGGLDVAILGLGRNAHIGFNEPGSAADSAGRMLRLTPTSIEANREWFGGDYAPDKGVTTGMKTLLAAKSVLLLAFGAAKATAVAAMMKGPQTPDCPASFLRSHPDTHIFLDQAAADQLKVAGTLRVPSARK